MSISKLTRWQINRICDEVPHCPSLDMKYASKVATKCVREKVRNQAIDISLVNDERIIEKLIEQIKASVNRAYIQDHVFVGFRISESLTVPLSQLSLDAFKAVGTKVNTGNLINILKGILKTVKDRSILPSTIIHFDLSYAKIPGYSFTFQEALDTQAYFTYRSFTDFFSDKGYVIGVLQGSPEDERNSTDILSMRRDYVDNFDFTEYSDQDKWTTLYGDLHSDAGIFSTVFFGRFYFDNVKMYAYGVGMKELKKALRNSLGDLDVDIVCSPFNHAIIDIYPTFVAKEEDIKISRQAERELKFLKSDIQINLSDIPVSGIPNLEQRNLIPTVLNTTVIRVELPILLNSKKVDNFYRIQELGRGFWIETLEKSLREKAKNMHWREFENKCYIREDGEIYFSEDLDILDQQATEEELNVLFENTFLGDMNKENIWMLELDVNRMKLNGVRTDQILNMLEFCGLDNYRIVKHSFLDCDGYIYIDNEEDPKKVIGRHSNWETYLNSDANISSFAKKWKKNRLAENKQDDDLKDILELERVFEYCYVTLETTQKAKSPVVPNLTNHLYAYISGFPWVYLEGTYSNDWYHMTLALGVDVAKNAYTIEPYQAIVASKSDIDPRHLNTFAKYVFEKGYPAGAGLTGVVSHRIDFFTEAMIAKADQRISVGYNRKPASSISTHFFTGATISMSNVEIRKKEVELMEQRNLEFRERVELAFGKKTKLLKNTAEYKRSLQNAQTEISSMSLAIAAKILAENPFIDIPMVKIEKYPAGYTGDVPSNIFTEISLNKIPNSIVVKSLENEIVKKKQYLANLLRAAVRAEHVIQILKSQKPRNLTAIYTNLQERYRGNPLTRRK